MNTYLNFLMQGEHESASYFARREEYKKKILDKISKGEEALIELPNGMHVTFYPMPASFRKTVYIQEAGLHVGSSVQDVFDAYPKDIDKTPSEEGGDPCYELYIDGVLTKFFYDEDTQKITSIKLSY